MLRKTAGLLVPLLFVVACGDDNATGPPTESLVGSWNAIAIELVSVANPAESVDLVAFGGSATLNLNQDGEFALTVSLPDELPETFGGTWSSTDVLTLVFTSGDISGEWQFDVNLTGDTLRLTGADTEFDFDDDGTDEPAKLNLTLVRV